MKLVFRITDRFQKTINLLDDGGHPLDNVSGEDDLFLLFNNLLEKNNAKISDLKSVLIESNGLSSWTNTRVAYALVNALNFSLGLKNLSELSYPPGPKDFYPESKG